ncbi:WAS/WASL-interacting protein family member 1-like [Rattus norvegicus]|uniref:WAS/WASL-interacting protein family member 1-like n=1 Tax=Rattus norvegicus TaxID=10116 RepID=UPI002FD8219D
MTTVKAGASYQVNMTKEADNKSASCPSKGPKFSFQHPHQRRRALGSGRPARPQPGTRRPPRVHPTSFLPDTSRRPRKPPARLRRPRHSPFSKPRPTILASPSPAFPRPAPAASRAAPGWPAAPPGQAVAAALSPPDPPARRPLPSPALPGPGLPGRAFTAGWRRGARSLTADGRSSDLPTGPARRARGRGENFCCGSSGDSSHPCAFLLFLPLLLLLFLLLFLLPEQSRGRHGAARASPRSPPLPARCIMGSLAHRKRSGLPALAWRGEVAARPSVALIPAPACQQCSVAREAGPALRVPLMGLKGKCFEIDQI